MQETNLPYDLKELREGPHKRDAAVWRELMETTDMGGIDALLEVAEHIFLAHPAPFDDEHAFRQEGNCLQEIALQLARFPGKGTAILRHCLNHDNFRTRIFARQTCMEWPEECLDEELKSKMGMN